MVRSERGACSRAAAALGEVDLMESRHSLWLWAVATLAFAVTSLVAGDQPERAIPLSDLRSGKEFLSADTRALQDDLTSNPGMLWVEQGEKLWQEKAGPEGRSCASCHRDAANLAGVAARYPVYDAATSGLLNLTGRIRQC